MSFFEDSIEIFHGSPRIVRSPRFGEGNLHNDYGLGFYCTRSVELAKEWACPEPKDGFANRYCLDLTGLDILDLQSGGYHILNWLAILLKNRIFETNAPLVRDAREYILEVFTPDYKSRDVIVGYRADDSYFSFARAFVGGAISLASLTKAMKLGRLGEQICVRSEQAFSQIRYLGCERAESREYYIKRCARDEKARRDYIELSKNIPAKDGIYVLDMLRQEWKNDDPRLR